MLMRRYYKAPYNHDGSKKAFNMGFHPTFLYIFPMAWVISLPFNFLIDSIFLLIGFKIFGKEKIWFNWRKSILKSWIFGYIADLVARAEDGDIEEEELDDSVYRILALKKLFAVLLAGVLIYVFNVKIALKKTELDDKAKKKVALLMAIATMPFPFFMPVAF